LAFAGGGEGGALVTAFGGGGSGAGGGFGVSCFSGSFNWINSGLGLMLDEGASFGG
jgi:hypothetical protein